MLWQDSVPRLKHVSALSCLHALQANSQDIPCRFAELESQSFIASEQLQKAAVEAAEMRSQMSEMVPRSELAAAMEECERWKARADEHARVVEDLGRRLEAAESAKAQIESVMAVRSPCSTPFALTLHHPWCIELLFTFYLTWIHSARRVFPVTMRCRLMGLRSLRSGRIFLAHRRTQRLQRCALPCYKRMDVSN